MAVQALYGPVQGLVVLAEAEAREVPRRIRRSIIEGADRYRRDACFDRDMPAEVLVSAVEAQRAEVRGDEIGAMGRQDLEADVRQRAGQPVALALHVAG